MLASSLYPSPLAFSRNPLLLTAASSSLLSFSVFDVTAGEQLLYTGHGEDEFTVNLAEIIDALFPDMPLSQGEDVIGDISSLGLKRDIRVDLENEEGDTASHSLGVLRGGTSLSRFRRMQEAGTDVFTLRFLNYKGNFFLTARSEGWIVPMGEVELTPLPFIAPAQPLVIRECHTGCVYLPPEGAMCQGGLSLLHVDRLREWFYRNCGVLPSLFDVLVGDVLACRVAVTLSAASPWYPVVRWLDAYGAWCRLQFQAPVLKHYAQPEQDDYLQYLPETDSFASRTGRRPLKASYSLSSGAMRPDKIRLIADMLASEAVFLQVPGITGEVRVIPAAEDLQFGERATEPESVSLSFRVTEQEAQPVLPVPEAGAEPPAVHSSQFDTIFN